MSILGTSIRLLDGRHLTATRRRAVHEIMDAGLLAGKVGRSVYRLTPLANAGEYSLTVEYRGSHEWDGKMREYVDRYTIRVEGGAS